LLGNLAAPKPCSLEALPSIRRGGGAVAAWPGAPSPRAGCGLVEIAVLYSLYRTRFGPKKLPCILLSSPLHSTRATPSGGRVGVPPPAPPPLPAQLHFQPSSTSSPAPPPASAYALSRFAPSATRPATHHWSAQWFDQGSNEQHQDPLLAFARNATAPRQGLSQAASAFVPSTDPVLPNASRIVAIGPSAYDSGTASCPGGPPHRVFAQTSGHLPP